jgi:hypothetical protein
MIPLSQDDVARIDVSRGIIRAQSGLECRYTLERERRWNIGLRRHHNALTGHIRVHAPNGASQCVSGWRAALALADKYAEQAWRQVSA